MPSRSSSSRSERSSCFAVVSSRNAANISVEPAIHSPPTAFTKDLRLRHQCRLANQLECDGHFPSILLPEYHVLIVRYRQDLNPAPARQWLGADPGMPAHEAPPMLGPAKRPLDPRRRNLQHVSRTDHRAGFEEAFERPADCGTVVRRHSLAGPAVRAIDPHLEDGALQRSAPPE